GDAALARCRRCGDSAGRDRPPGARRGRHRARRPGRLPGAPGSGVSMTAVDSRQLRDDVRQWSGLVRTGAWAAAASVALIVVQIVVYVVWPPPRTTAGHFTELLANPVLGLLGLDVLYIVSNLLA